MTGRGAGLGRSAVQGASGGATGRVTRWVAVIERWRPLAKHFGVNARQHWRSAAAQVKRAHGRTTDAMLCAQWPRELYGPAIVTITIHQHIGKEPDSDALVILPKAIRDAVAEWFVVDDGPTDPIQWRYAWQRGPDSVTIELEELP